MSPNVTRSHGLCRFFVSVTCFVLSRSDSVPGAGTRVVAQLSLSSGVSVLRCPCPARSPALRGGHCARGALCCWLGPQGPHPGPCSGLFRGAGQEASPTPARREAGRLVLAAGLTQHHGGRLELHTRGPWSPRKTRGPCGAREPAADNLLFLLLPPDLICFLTVTLFYLGQARCQGSSRGLSLALVAPPHLSRRGQAKSRDGRHPADAEQAARSARAQPLPELGRQRGRRAWRLSGRERVAAKICCAFLAVKVHDAIHVPLPGAQGTP